MLDTKPDHIGVILEFHSRTGFIKSSVVFIRYDFIS